MGSVAMVYTPSFVKIGRGVQKFVDGMQRHAESTVNAYDYIYYYLFKNKLKGA
jgi:hypothetical protein